MSVFPELTGRFPVGILHEEFEFKGTEPGTLPLTLIYPAKMGTEEKEKYSFSEALFGLPLCEEETRFLKNAKIAGEEEKWPVVFYNHGYRSYEMSNSILCGELASRGYIVAVLGHTTEATAVRLKDGSVILMDAQLNAETDDPVKEAALQEIIKELASLEDTEENLSRFIEAGERFSEIHQKSGRMEIWCERIAAAADFLETYNKGDGLLSGHLDLASGFGLTGHSFGGAAAIPVLRKDARFVCGIDIDGADLEYHYGETIGKPFMSIGNGLTSKFLKAVYQSNTADAFQLVIEDVEHMGFTDLAYFLEIADMLKIPLGSRKADETNALLVQYHDLFFRKYLKKESISWETEKLSGVTLRFKKGV